MHRAKKTLLNRPSFQPTALLIKHSQMFNVIFCPSSSAHIGVPTSGVKGTLPPLMTLEGCRFCEFLCLSYSRFACFYPLYLLLSRSANNNFTTQIIIYRLHSAIVVQRGEGGDGAGGRAGTGVGAVMTVSSL